MAQQNILGVLKTSLNIIKTDFVLMNENVKRLQTNLAVLTATVGFHNMLLSIQSNLKELKDLFNNVFN